MEIEILEMTFLYAVLIPGAVAGTAFLFLPRRMAPVGMALGYLTGYLGVQGIPQFPPHESSQWFPFILIAAVILCLFLRSEKGVSLKEWLLVVAFLSIMFYLLLSIVSFQKINHRGH